MRFIKRLSALVSIIALLAVSTSCGGEHKELRPFQDALDAASPNTAALHSEIDTEFGKVGTDYTASYSGSTVTVEYTRNTVGTITPDTEEDDLFPTERGTATINADGTVTGEIGALAKSLLTLAITLDGDAIAYEVKESTLDFTVSAENTERVFGVNIGYPVTVVLELSDERITKITVTYTASSGDATVWCEYGY